MARGRITNFIVDGSEYFAAHLDHGGARIGLVGGVMLDVMPHNVEHLAKILSVKTESEAEALFDHFIEAGTIFLA